MNEKVKIRRISFKPMFLLSLLTNKDSYNTQIIQCVNDTIFRKRFRVPGFGTGSGTLEPVPWNRFLRQINRFLGTGSYVKSLSYASRFISNPIMHQCTSVPNFTKIWQSALEPLMLQQIFPALFSGGGIFYRFILRVEWTKPQQTWGGRTSVRHSRSR